MDFYLDVCCFTEGSHNHTESYYDKYVNRGLRYFSLYSIRVDGILLIHGETKKRAVIRLVI